jgi:hypothetical protein
MHLVLSMHLVHAGPAKYEDAVAAVTAANLLLHLPLCHTLEGINLNKNHIPGSLHSSRVMPHDRRALPIPKSLSPIVAVHHLAPQSLRSVMAIQPVSSKVQPSARLSKNTQQNDRLVALQIVAVLHAHLAVLSANSCWRLL